MKNCSKIEKKGKLGEKGRKGEGRGKKEGEERRKLRKEGRKTREERTDRQTDQSLLTCETQSSNLNTYIGVFEGAEKEEAGYNV